MKSNQYCHALAEGVQEQVDAIKLDPARPLLLCDADEVLLKFAECFEAYLAEIGYILTLNSYSLFGNIHKESNGTPMSEEGVSEHVELFFSEWCHRLDPVAGAEKALTSLSRHCEIIVVSNIPLAHRQARATHLGQLSMDYPLIANIGPKGPLVAQLAAKSTSPVLFIDDTPQHIRSVARVAPEVHRVHFVADPRLRALLDPAPDCHHRVDEWPLAKNYIADILGLTGPVAD